MLKYGFYLMESQVDPHSLYGDYEMVGPTVTENGFATEQEAMEEAEKSKNINLASGSYYDIHIYSYDTDAKITEEVKQNIMKESKECWEPFVVYNYKEYPVEEVRQIINDSKR